MEDYYALVFLAHIVLRLACTSILSTLCIVLRLACTSVLSTLCIIWYFHALMFLAHRDCHVLVFLAHDVLF